ncbi:LysR family transcriptional regulator [Algibacillus agarilyticus]|uniref:LysR family transcriptional regulator n=1 Tax=Algibacillus agarilyticus TaxID=2234133 RepID=UPI000DCFFEB6|nr:LysR family transcriptional regulator [Algibacillus agarilyticus]
MSLEHKKLERLMLFHEVAKQLNFAAAAKQLHISRGYLSDQIKQLELDLNTTLLIRTTRSVRLTQDGQHVLNCGTEIKSALLNLNRSIGELEGCINITAPKLFAERYLLNLCQKFKNQHPNITFNIDTSYTAFDLNQANFDLAFRATLTPPENMVASPLFSYQHVCCASPQYYAQYGKPKSLLDLTQHNCLTGPEQSSWPFASGHINVKGNFIINDHPLLKLQAIQGLGIVRMPSYYVNQEITAGLLAPCLEHEYIKGYDIYLIHPPRVQHLNNLQAFIQFIKLEFKHQSDDH